MATVPRPENVVIWIPADKVETLFGTLGTATEVAGAAVKLLDEAQRNSVKGRQEPATPSADLCVWSYLHPKSGERQGPFTWQKLSKWIEKGVMQPDILLERGDVRCWLPLWLAATATKCLLPAVKKAPPPASTPVLASPALPAVINGEGFFTTEVEMEERSDNFAAMLEWERAAGHALSLMDMPCDMEGVALGVVALPLPMDIAVEGHAARLYLVVDTNILLTHLAVLEHLRTALGRGSAAARGPGEGGSAEVDVVVVVPWIVLYELDRIKSERPDSEGLHKMAAHARAAIRHLAQEAERPPGERFYVGESLTEFKQAAAALGGRGRTPNDDRVLFCALARRERAGAADAAVLLTRDANLRVKAAACDLEALGQLEGGLADTALFFLQKQHGNMWTGVTDKEVPWSVQSLLEMLVKDWKSVYEDVVVELDRRPAQAAIGRLKASQRFLARTSGPAGANGIAEALKDIALLLNAFPAPEGALPEDCEKAVEAGPAAEALLAARRRVNELERALRPRPDKALAAVGTLSGALLSALVTAHTSVHRTMAAGRAPSAEEADMVAHSLLALQREAVTVIGCLGVDGRGRDERAAAVAAAAAGG
ncbi:hypothetical protein WJX81_006975 [Elliptochloris bilobata]|uniref:PIN domain-containing protein n=1 Tax=Elliptochloris bilobata TaxID=381761 RepID=A0AAW1SEQ7_9CHLO